MTPKLPASRFYQLTRHGPASRNRKKNVMALALPPVQQTVRWVSVGGGFNTVTQSQDNVLSYSSDGINWQSSSAMNTLMYRGEHVAYNGNIWVAVGTAQFNGSGTNNGTPLYAFTGTPIMYSSDGINWNGATSSLSFQTFPKYNVVAWNGLVWIAIGENTVVYSTDGMKWNKVNVVNIENMDKNIHGLTWNNGSVVGTGFWLAAGMDYCYTSSDGITWNVISNIPSQFIVNEVAVSPNSGSSSDIMFVSNMGNLNNVVNPDIIFYSNGNLNNAPFVSSAFAQPGPFGNTQSVFGVASSGNMWVVVGQSYLNLTIAYSTDGKNWSQAKGETIFFTGRSVAWNSFTGMWVVVGEGFGYNNIGYSTDGINWKQAIVPSNTAKYIAHVASNKYI